MANPERFIIKQLAFTGKDVPVAQLDFEDGVNVIWGASNTGKSFVVKALDFMTGAGDELPDIDQRKGYDKAWLKLSLPKSGPVMLARATNGGGFGLYTHRVEPGTKDNPDRTLSAEQRGKNPSVSSFLLAELGIADRKIAKNQSGEKVAFTFRHFAPYIFVEETEMLAESSPIQLSEYSNETLDKNALKFILTGVDDTAVVTVPSAKTQKTANSGKIELLDEMIVSIENELQRDYPDSLDLENQDSKITETIEALQKTVAEHQDRLDQLRSDRRITMDALAETEERQTEIALTLERFEVLRSVYDNDIERLASLDEGSAALLAGARRPCPLCGADPQHQSLVHGFDEIERAQKAIRTEIAKIRAERTDLLRATASLQAEQESHLRKVDRLANSVTSIDGEIEETRPLEVSTRKEYDRLRGVRDHLRHGIRLSQRWEDLKRKRGELGAFKASPIKRGTVSVGVGGIIGHELAHTVQEVLHAWQFPGSPTVSFDAQSHDILINGKNRRANGKGVRALMNAALKIGILVYCRRNNHPHPGVLVLDSPLVTYRGPHSRHGELSADEEELKRTSLNELFYRFLLNHADYAQFIVIENDEPPFTLAPTAQVTTFSGGSAQSGRSGFF